jgi:hypothetical protein
LTYVYDTIIERKGINFEEFKKISVINLKNKKHEYELKDVYHSLAGKEVRVNLGVEVMPIVGYIYRVKK